METRQGGIIIHQIPNSLGTLQSFSQPGFSEKHYMLYSGCKHIHVVEYASTAENEISRQWLLLTLCACQADLPLAMYTEDHLCLGDDIRVGRESLEV